MDGKSSEREVWWRGAVVTEGWKSGTSALREQFVIEHRRRGRGACTWRRRRRLCQKRQHSSCNVLPFPVVHSRSRRLFIRLRSLSVEFVAGAAADVRRRSEKSLDRVGAVTKCRRAALSVSAVNRCAARWDRLWDVRRVCCVSASNLSTTTTTKCLADDRRGCFLIAKETHLTSNTLLTCCGRVRTVTIVLLSSSSPSLANRRHRQVPGVAAWAGAGRLVDQSLTDDGTFDLAADSVADAASLLCVYGFVTSWLPGVNSLNW